MTSNKEAKNLEIKKKLKKLYNTRNSKECFSIAREIGNDVTNVENIKILFGKDGILNTYKESLSSKKVCDREGGYLGYYGLVENLGMAIEPMIIDEFENIVRGCSDKIVAVRNAAFQTSKIILKNVHLYQLREVCIPALVTSLSVENVSLQGSCLELIGFAAEISSSEIHRMLPELLPLAINFINNSSPNISKAALFCVEKLCSTLINPEIKSHVPHLIEFFKNPDQVENCLRLIADTTFVAEITNVDLLLLLPILRRALSERNSKILLLCCKIIASVFRLVLNCSGLEPVLEEITPLVSRICEHATNPEVREISTTSLKVLNECSERTKAHSNLKKASEVLKPVVSSI